MLPIELVPSIKVTEPVGVPLEDDWILTLKVTD